MLVGLLLRSGGRITIVYKKQTTSEHHHILPKVRLSRLSFTSEHTANVETAARVCKQFDWLK